MTFMVKGDPGFDVYHISARLRENGWIVPAYTLPPDAEDVHAAAHGKNRTRQAR